MNREILIEAGISSDATDKILEFQWPDSKLKQFQKKGESFFLIALVTLMCQMNLLDKASCDAVLALEEEGIESLFFGLNALKKFDGRLQPSDPEYKKNVEKNRFYYSFLMNRLQNAADLGLCLSILEKIKIDSSAIISRLDSLFKKRNGSIHDFTGAVLHFNQRNILRRSTYDLLISLAERDLLNRTHYHKIADCIVMIEKNNEIRPLNEIFISVLFKSVLPNPIKSDSFYNALTILEKANYLNQTTFKLLLYRKDGCFKELALGLKYLYPELIRAREERGLYADIISEEQIKSDIKYLLTLESNKIRSMGQCLAILRRYGVSKRNTIGHAGRFLISAYKLVAKEKNILTEKELKKVQNSDNLAIFQLLLELNKEGVLNQKIKESILSNVKYIKKKIKKFQKQNIHKLFFALKKLSLNNLFECYKILLDIDKEFCQYVDELAKGLIILNDHGVLEKKFQESKGEKPIKYKEFLAENPKNAESFARLFVYLNKSKEPKYRKYSFYQELLENPDHTALILDGLSLLDEAHFEERIDDFQEVLLKNPQNAPLLAKIITQSYQNKNIKMDFNFFSTVERCLEALDQAKILDSQIIQTGLIRHCDWINLLENILPIAAQKEVLTKRNCCLFFESLDNPAIQKKIIKERHQPVEKQRFYLIFSDIFQVSTLQLDEKKEAPIISASIPVAAERKQLNNNSDEKEKDIIKETSRNLEALRELDNDIFTDILWKSAEEAAHSERERKTEESDMVWLKPLYEKTRFFVSQKSVSGDPDSKRICGDQKLGIDFFTPELEPYKIKRRKKMDSVNQGEANLEMKPERRTVTPPAIAPGRAPADDRPHSFLKPAADQPPLFSGSSPTLFGMSSRPGQRAGSHEFASSSESAGPTGSTDRIIPTKKN